MLGFSEFFKPLQGFGLTGLQGLVQGPVRYRGLRATRCRPNDMRGDR